MLYMILRPVIYDFTADLTGIGDRSVRESSLCACLCVSVHIETYGCQMNVNDTEIAWSILRSHGFTQAANLQDVSYALGITLW